MDYPSTYASQFLRNALTEDIGPGDITSAALVPVETTAKAFIKAKCDGVLAGMTSLIQVYSILSSMVEVVPLLEEGDTFASDDFLAEINGFARPILAGERVALNVLSRLCGVATATSRFVNALSGTGCKVLDTRKTTPGMRLLEKYAVSIGGGTNHRIGLWDMILVKENHIAISGGVSNALKRLFSDGKPLIPVVVEVRNLAELEEAFAFPVERIMLDNFSISDVEAAVELREKGGFAVPFEVSGGITPENCRQYAEAGVEFISSGYITQSAPPCDISMIFQGAL